MRQFLNFTMNLFFSSNMHTNCKRPNIVVGIETRMLRMISVSLQKQLHWVWWTCWTHQTFRLYPAAHEHLLTFGGRKPSKLIDIFTKSWYQSWESLIRNTLMIYGYTSQCSYHIYPKSSSLSNIYKCNLPIMKTVYKDYWIWIFKHIFWNGFQTIKVWTVQYLPLLM